MLCFGPEAKLFKIMKRMRVWIFAIKKMYAYCKTHMPSAICYKSVREKKEREKAKKEKDCFEFDIVPTQI